MKKALIYIHGKGGNILEADHYKTLFPDFDVVGFDYQAETPWEAKGEFLEYFRAVGSKYDCIEVIANSIGGFFAMNALNGIRLDQVYLISPIVNMEKLITDMMGWACVTEADLQNAGTIATSFGETLSYEYLSYVRKNPFEWKHPTDILYGSRDHLQSRETMEAFSAKIGARLTVMEDGEHWFHTKEQMAFLDEWIIGNRL